MTEKKITKIEMFERIKSKLTNQEDIEFIERQIELTRKKNSNKRVVDKNVDLRNAIYETLVENGEPLTCGEIVKCMGYEYNDQPLTTQKVSPQIKKLVEEGLVLENLDKKVKTYKVVEI